MKAINLVWVLLTLGLAGIAGWALRNAINEARAKRAKR